MNCFSLQELFNSLLQFSTIDNSRILTIIENLPETPTISCEANYLFLLEDFFLNEEKLKILIELTHIKLQSPMTLKKKMLINSMSIKLKNTLKRLQLLTKF